MKASEALLRLHQELHVIDGAVAIEREGQVQVNDVAEGRAARSEPQADADILEQSALLSRDGSGTPRAAGIEEDRAAEVEQADEIV